MKALTIHQPYAHLIVHGIKKVENRSWVTGYRGPLVIHAGRSKERLSAVDDPVVRELTPDIPAAGELVLGAIVGVARLTGCYELTPAAPVWGTPFAEGPICWVLEDARAFEVPIPYRGERGLFVVPDDVLPASQ